VIKLDFWDERNSQRYSSESRDKLEPDESYLLDLILKAEASTVLEIGAGYGRILKKIAHRFPHCYGIDKSLTAYELSESYLKGTNAILYWCDVIDLHPFRDNSIDLVFDCGTLAHVSPESLQQALNEVFRVSNKFVILMEYQGTKSLGNNFVNYHKHSWIHEIPELIALKQDVAFLCSREIILGLDKFVLVVARKEAPKKSFWSRVL